MLWWSFHGLHFDELTDHLARAFQCMIIFSVISDRVARILHVLLTLNYIGQDIAEGQMVLVQVQGMSGFGLVLQSFAFWLGDLPEGEDLEQVVSHG